MGHLFSLIFPQVSCALKNVSPLTPSNPSEPLTLCLRSLMAHHHPSCYKSFPPYFVMAFMFIFISNSLKKSWLLHTSVTVLNYSQTWKYPYEFQPWTHFPKLVAFKECLILERSRFRTPWSAHDNFAPHFMYKKMMNPRMICYFETLQNETLSMQTLVWAKSLTTAR